MVIKIIIVLLILGILISLISSFVFLMKDQGSESKRTVNSLGVRVTLGTLLIIVVTYGLMTGQLQYGSPWKPTQNSQEVKESP